MTGNSIGKLFKITTFGESHGPALGVIIDGCPPGIPINQKDIQQELDLRRPGTSPISSPRKESDHAEILSGIFKGLTTGQPISIIIRNKDTDSSAYSAIKDTFRPGHADFTYQKKYGIRDYRGGGRSSGRETTSRVAAGAIAKKFLSKYHIEITAFTRQVGKIIAKGFDPEEIKNNPLRCPDPTAAKKMYDKILKIQKKGDSIGGMIECIIKNCPIGLGMPVFDKLDADLAKAMLSIGATKGIEFGDGFDAATKKGSENNDFMSIKNNDAHFKTNHSGGILGGISSGTDIVFRIAVKPTPSIIKEQETITSDNKDAFIKIKGRHDPCICPRICPVVEAMAALTIADHILRQKAISE